MRRWMRLSSAVFMTHHRSFNFRVAVLGGLLGLTSLLLATPSARTENIIGFTRQVSPPAQTNATEPSVAVDRADGTVYVAWQASGTHVARSDDGGRTFTQELSKSDVGDVDIRVGGPTPCAAITATCIPGKHRVYVSSIEELPLPLQTHLAYSDDRGAN